ncbi:hypothetical protein PR001_g32280, partial [Phytophthora rubi]
MQGVQSVLETVHTTTGLSCGSYAAGPHHTDTWFAAGASVARAAPLYAHTIKQSSAPDKLQVVYQTPLSGAQTTLVQHTVDAIQLAARPGVQLRDQGFGGIYGVGKAATHKPALVCLSHVPEGAAEDAKGVAMVEKGIIFDTGGFMVGMKRDLVPSARQTLQQLIQDACYHATFSHVVGPGGE